METNTGDEDEYPHSLSGSPLGDLLGPGVAGHPCEPHLPSPSQNQPTAEAVGHYGRYSTTTSYYNLLQATTSYYYYNFLVEGTIRDGVRDSGVQP